DLPGAAKLKVLVLADDENQQVIVLAEQFNKRKAFIAASSGSEKLSAETLMQYWSAENAQKQTLETSLADALTYITAMNYYDILKCRNSKYWKQIAADAPLERGSLLFYSPVIARNHTFRRLPLVYLAIDKNKR